MLASASCHPCADQLQLRLYLGRLVRGWLWKDLLSPLAPHLPPIYEDQLTCAASSKRCFSAAPAGPSEVRNRGQERPPWYNPQIRSPQIILPALSSLPPSLKLELWMVWVSTMFRALCLRGSNALNNQTTPPFNLSREVPEKRGGRIRQGRGGGWRQTCPVSRRLRRVRPLATNSGQRREALLLPTKKRTTPPNPRSK